MLSAEFLPERMPGVASARPGQAAHSPRLFSLPPASVSLTQYDLDHKGDEVALPTVQNPILSEIIQQLKTNFAKYLDPKTFDIYIKPLGGRSLHDSESSDAVAMLEKFVEHPVQRSILVLADSGGGKTL